MGHHTTPMCLYNLREYHVHASLDGEIQSCLVIATSATNSVGMSQMYICSRQYRCRNNVPAAAAECQAWALSARVGGAGGGSLVAATVGCCMQ